jgi:hypothetical protein
MEFIVGKWKKFEAILVQGVIKLHGRNGVHCGKIEKIRGHISTRRVINLHGRNGAYCGEAEIVSWPHC